MQHICPLCGSRLTEGHYHKVMKIRAKEKKVQKGELEKLKKAAAAASQRERDGRVKAKQRAEEARKEGKLAEKKRSERLMQGQASKIKKLQDRVKMLEKGTTPQGIGLADEPALVIKLKKEFPDDRIEHAGKGGDVLHFARFKGADVGSIVY